MNNKKFITKEYLRNNPNHLFVFGDNLIRKGKAGAAKLRDEPNSYGFITKKYPDMKKSSFYSYSEYFEIYYSEIEKLKEFIRNNNYDKILISAIGSGLANKFGIFNIIKENIETDLSEFEEKIEILF